MQTNKAEDYNSQVDEVRDKEERPSNQTNKRKNERTQQQDNKVAKKTWEKKPRFSDYNNPRPDTVPQASGFLEPLDPLRYIQVDLHGMDRIASVTYDLLLYRDQRIRNPQFTKARFQHICNLLVFYRLYYNAQSLGTYSEFNIPGDFSTISALKTLELPSNVVDYVQTIGRIILDHQKYAPYVPSIPEFFNGPMNTFFELDDNGNRVTDENGELVPCTLENFVQQFPIHIFTISSIRTLTVSKGFVRVDFEVLEGKPELSVSYRVTDIPYLIEPRCFASQSNSVANRGASYRFWNSNEEREFGEVGLDDKFFGVRFNDEQLLANTAKLILK